jgi:hypothetical protein
MKRRAPWFVADFDSASAMLQATARFLNGQDFPALGLSRRLEPLAIAVNLLPRALRRFVYIRGGVQEAIAPARLEDVRAEEIARWATELYPRRTFPAIAIGSSNGALVHLYAALGIPWLPQTVLIPVRQDAAGPDQPHEAMDFGAKHAARFLAANPELQLHHMHDPNQDRLMLHGMTYFRVKRLRLGPTYERFITQGLQSGGTIIVADCRLRWPTTRVGERHVFQFGGFGGLPADEHFTGSERIAAFLEHQKSSVDRWQPPSPDGDSPESEWGFEEVLAQDIERMAHERDYRVLRLSFDEPDDLAAPVADLYRRWYVRSGVPARRLLVESFVLLDPWLVARTRSVPFWTTFPVERSAGALEWYLENAEPYDEIRIALFAHGMQSIGVASPERWRAALARARRHGAFLGTRAKAFPEDFAVFARFYKELSALPERHAVPPPLPLTEIDQLIAPFGAVRISLGSKGS